MDPIGENDTQIDQYGFYDALGLSSVQTKDSQTETRKINFLATPPPIQDTLVSATIANEEKELIEKETSEKKSFWGDLWQKTKDFFTFDKKETIPQSNEKASTNQNAPVIDPVPELTPGSTGHLKKEISAIFMQIEMLSQSEEHIDPDTAFSAWLTKLTAVQNEKIEDTKEEYKNNKAKNKIAREEFNKIAEEFISLDKKRKIASWVDMGTSIGATVIGGLFSLISSGFGNFVQSAIKGALDAGKAATGITQATFKYMTEQMRSKRIDLKEKLKDQEDKVAKNVKDLGESFKRVNDYFRRMNECLQNWRRTVISFFRR